MKTSTFTARVFNVNDRISCILVSYGRQILSFHISGIRSIQEIYAHILARLQGAKGVFTVNLRNITQGWSNRYPICLR